LAAPGSVVFVIILFCWTLPAKAADYPVPLSFSNAELKGRTFPSNLQAAEFSNANMELANFADADLRGHDSGEFMERI